MGILHYALREMCEAHKDMQGSVADKRDISLDPVTVVAAVLALFWGAVAVLLWYLF